MDDKPLSHMTDAEILEEIRKIRERRAQSKKAVVTRAAAKGGPKTARVGLDASDLADLLEGD